MALRCETRSLFSYKKLFVMLNQEELFFIYTSNGWISYLCTKISMMKKLFTLSLMTIVTTSMYAQSPLDSVSGGMATYVPVVKSVIYGLAGAVAVISCLVIYIKSQNEGYSYKKDVFVTVCSCLFLVCSATALPQFFGLDNSSDSGLLADNSNGSTGGNNGAAGDSSDDYLGQPINPNIPALDSPKWVTFPEGSSVRVRNIASKIWYESWGMDISASEFKRLWSNELDHLTNIGEITNDEGGQIWQCLEYIYNQKNKRTIL